MNARTTAPGIGARLRAVWDLTVPVTREIAGRHEYDGRIQDLSVDGVRRDLARLPDTARTTADGAWAAQNGTAAGAGDPAAAGAPTDGEVDERHLAVFENAQRAGYGELAQHRSNPYLHLANLELSSYDREYAPAAERAAARRRHLAQWPDAVDVAVRTLDRLSAPVAAAVLPAVAGLVADVPADDPLAAPALAAHGRLLRHVRGAARHGDPDAVLGGPALARLMGAAEGLPVDLSALSRQAETERNRLTALLHAAADRLAPGVPLGELVQRLLAEHPAPHEVLARTRELVAEVIAFTRRHQLVPDLDGECRVAPAPPARAWVKAMLTWAGPEEADNPSWYHLTLSAADWPAERRAEWMTSFSATTLPAVTVHEVAPGHFAHGRALRRAAGPVRRTLHSAAFMEGWAHYTEELVLELGFREADPRFAIGVVLEALVRLTRLRCAIGLHTGAIDVAEAARCFERDALVAPAVARSEAERGMFDPTYGRYTWGKLLLRDAQRRAREQCGSAFSLAGFHAELMALGCPPLSLIEVAVERTVARATGATPPTPAGVAAR